MIVPPRDLTPFMRFLRNFLLGRKFKNSLRFQDFVATRSPPDANLPDGVSHKLSGNYYFTRDGRHEFQPPKVLIAENKKLAIESGVKENAQDTAAASKKVGHIYPGNPYIWKEPTAKQPQT